MERGYGEEEWLRAQYKARVGMAPLFLQCQMSTRVFAAIPA